MVELILNLYTFVSTPKIRERKIESVRNQFVKFLIVNCPASCYISSDPFPFNLLERKLDCVKLFYLLTVTQTRPISLSK